MRTLIPAKEKRTLEYKKNVLAALQQCEDIEYVAKKYQVGVSTIIEWRRKYVKYGDKGLVDKRSEKTKKIDDQHYIDLVSNAAKRYPGYGTAFLAEYLRIEFRCKLSPTTIQTILDNEGLGTRKQRYEYFLKVKIMNKKVGEDDPLYIHLTQRQLDFMEDFQYMSKVKKNS